MYLLIELDGKITRAKKGIFWKEKVVSGFFYLVNIVERIQIIKLHCNFHLFVGLSCVRGNRPFFFFELNNARCSPFFLFFYMTS